jgi:hypothetical protein
VERYHELHRQAISDGVGLQVRPIDSDCIKHLLQNGDYVIAGIKLKGSEFLHWIVIRGFDGDTFQVFDPMNITTHLRSAELDDALDTYMGRRLVVIHNRAITQQGKATASIEVERNLFS